MSNEKEIRKAFKKLVQEYDSEILIVDEFCGGTMRTRADLALIKKDSLIMVEIKSDKDTLARLENQISDYCKYSTNVFVILDIIHREKYMKLKEKSSIIRNLRFELLFYENKFENKGNLDIPILNNWNMKREDKKITMYELLWFKEKQQLIKFIKGRTNCNLEETIKFIYSYDELCTISNAIIFDRVKRNTNFTKDFKMNNGVDFGRFEDIKHKEHKQMLAIELKEETRAKYHGE